ncbi:toxin-activating lysine-acyltransferase [Hydrogenophaga sp.]|uniref:toxin-activating lysine-acyltransferase n=1 Tax=Hydrogenophaga sp. TaxID=1904254 RepID=UPI003F6F775E
MKANVWQLEAPWLQRRPVHADAAMGAAVWLWMHDLQRRGVAMSDLEHRLLAPIEAGQYVLARRSAAASSMHTESPSHRPLALLLFARFDAQAETRYLAHPSKKIAIRDWQSGDRLWLIDWTAPFGHTAELRRPLTALLDGHGARSVGRSQHGTAAHASTSSVGSRVRLWQQPQDASVA